MAETAEGFTVNANIVLDESSASGFIADIYHDVGIISENTISYNGTVLLNNTDESFFLGEIKRANLGSYGFTIKSSVTLESEDDTLYIADIAHGRIITSEKSDELLSSVILDNIEQEKVIGDILRSNQGCYGFTVKSILSIDESNLSDFLGELSYPRSVTREDNRDITSTLIIDLREDSKILADIKRANFGQQGFPLKALSRLDNYDNNQNIADIYRSISGRSCPKTQIIYYKGKKYFLSRIGSLYYIITEAGNEETT